MKKLVDGLERFLKTVHESEKNLFESLAVGQNPEVLFITCSDSRVDPNLITQTQPGDLFVIRNAGNIIPPYGTATGGELATVEYAVKALEVEHIIVCGHSDCGAMKGLMNPKSLEGLRLVNQWLAHAETVRSVVETQAMNAKKEWTDAEILNAAIEVNVLLQLQHLQTHPSVAAQVHQGKLALHGWIFDIGKGEVRSFESDERKFVSLQSFDELPNNTHFNVAFHKAHDSTPTS